MSRVKFQHYVPRFYLENFCDSTGKVWVYDKHLGKTYCTKAENTGGETHFYDVAEVDDKMGEDQFIEKMFGELEGEWAYVLGRWLQKLEADTYFRIYDEERVSFALFLAMQLLRTPSHRHFAIQMAEIIGNMDFQAYLEQRNPALAAKNPKIRIKAGTEASIHAQSILDGAAVETYVGELLRHVWIVTPNRSSIPLLASDSPVTRCPHKRGFGIRSFSGIGSKGIQISFPLSPGYSLSLLERSYFKKLEKLDGRLSPYWLTNENVVHDNSLQVRHSSRFIFSPRKDDFDLAKEMGEENPELRNPARAQLQTDRPGFQNEGTCRED